MDDPVLVRGFERLGDLLRHRKRLVERQGAPRDSVGERRAFDQLHHQGVLAAGIFEAVDLRDVRMIEGREELRFAAEPCEAIGIVGDGGQQDLDGHVAIQSRIAGAIDLAHPTRADARRDPVTAEELTLEALGRQGGVERHGRRFQEVCRLLVRRQQPLGLLTQRFVAVACRGEVGRPCVQRQHPCALE